MDTLGEQVENNSGQNDGYLELKDIFETANGFHNDDFFGHTGENYVNEPTAVLQVDYTSLYFDNANENMNSNGSGPVNSVFRPTDLNPVSHDYPSAKLVADDENIFFDAFSHNFSFTEDILDDMNNASGYDMVDDLFAYFDATENNLQNDMEIFNSEVDSSHVAVPTTCIQHVQEKHLETGTSYSASSSQNETLNEGNNALPELQSNTGWKISLKKHAVNMLSSISAPPAMAEECSTAIKANPASKLLRTPTSSLHATAGFIKIQNILLTDSMDIWSTEKIIEHSEFQLSYEPVIKTRGAFSTVLRCGFYLFGVSVLILSASLNIGTCLYNK